MADEKWLHTMEVYDDYEREIARLRSEKELVFPITEQRRAEIIKETKRILGYKEELVPTVHNAEELQKHDFGEYTVTQLRYETWDNFFGCASFFLPKGEGKVPMVFLLCGHGDDGRRTRSYVMMAHKLASAGVAVVIPDNIGQGDRQDEGKENHNFCHTPFYCGISLQGMIVMETHAVVKYMINHPRADKDRIGACGNSGGGTLSLFAAATIPEIKVLSASGYPCDFTYILMKERRHCCCNLLPGIACGPEMWEVLSTFAPKPMLLEQGQYDDLIPIDLAQRNARKVQNVYIQLGKKENFNFMFTKEKHSWTEADILAISEFLLKHLGIPFDNSKPSEEITEKRSEWHVDILDRSLKTAEIAEVITGIAMPEDTQLWDIIKPKYKGRVISGDEIVNDIGRGDVMRVLAQFECTVRGYGDET